MTLEEALKKLKSGNYPSGSELDLSLERLGDKGAQVLAEALASGNCSSGLRLRLENNSITYKGAEALAEVLISSNCLTELKLNENKIYDQGAQVLARALMSGNCLPGFSLGLYETNLSDKGALAVAEALKSGNCPSRLRLYLGYNHIGYLGALALAEALKSGNCPSRLRLYLGNNHIGYKGARALAEALQSGNCPTGLGLFLQNNKIGYKGAQAFAKALWTGNCPSGLSLDLIWNNIGRGAKSLASPLVHGVCQFGTTIDVYHEHDQNWPGRIDFDELALMNDRRIMQQSRVAIATLLGGHKGEKHALVESIPDKLPIDLKNIIASFLCPCLSAMTIEKKLNNFFITALKNTMVFSDEFLQKHSGLNQRIQTQYDKKFGLSLWQCTEDYRKRYLEKNPIKTGSSDRKMCAIL